MYFSLTHCNVCMAINVFPGTKYSSKTNMGWCRDWGKECMQCTPQYVCTTKVLSNLKLFSEGYCFVIMYQYAWNAVFYSTHFFNITTQQLWNNTFFSWFLLHTHAFPITKAAYAHKRGFVVLNYTRIVCMYIIVSFCSRRI